jgi:hypothetical protein
MSTAFRACLASPFRSRSSMRDMTLYFPLTWLFTGRSRTYSRKLADAGLCCEMDEYDGNTNVSQRTVLSVLLAILRTSPSRTAARYSCISSNRTALGYSQALLFHPDRPSLNKRECIVRDQSKKLPTLGTTPPKVVDWRLTMPQRARSSEDAFEAIARTVRQHVAARCLAAQRPA